MEPYQSIHFYCPVKCCKETFWTTVYDGGDMDESFCPNHEDAYRDMMDERQPAEKRSKFYPRLRNNPDTQQFKNEMRTHLDDKDREFVLHEVI